MDQDEKLAENLSPITKKVDEVNRTTKKLGETVNKSDVEDVDTQALAIENTQNDTHAIVIYHTSLEKTLTHMKKQKRYFTMEERGSGDLFWNLILIEMLTDLKLKINDYEYDRSTNLKKFSQKNLKIY